MSTCRTCRHTLDGALAAAGITHHPTCAPDAPLSAEQLRDAVALLADHLGARLTERDCT